MSTADHLVTLRAAGWSVAIHHDYTEFGQPHTFWLFTHPDGRWISGRGSNDKEAIGSAYMKQGIMTDAAKASTASVAVAPVLTYLAAVGALGAPVPRMPGAEYNVEMKRRHAAVRAARVSLDAALAQSAASGSEDLTTERRE